MIEEIVNLLASSGQSLTARQIAQTMRPRNFTTRDVLWCLVAEYHGVDSRVERRRSSNSWRWWWVEPADIAEESILRDVEVDEEEIHAEPKLKYGRYGRPTTW